MNQLQQSQPVVPGGKPQQALDMAAPQASTATGSAAASSPHSPPSSSASTKQREHALAQAAGPLPPSPPRSTSIPSSQQQEQRQNIPPLASFPVAASPSRAAKAAPSDSGTTIPPSFARRKAAVLAQLSLPDEEYEDLSPKGTVDAGIRDLIGEINAREGLVTTSSCAGRVSVFLEGRRKASGAGAGRGGAAGSGDGGAADGIAGEPLLPGHPFAVDEEGAAAMGGDTDILGKKEESEQQRQFGDDVGGDEEVRTVAGIGGKGGGGRWLFVSHDPVETNGKLDSEPNIVAALLGLEEPIFDGRDGSSAEEMSGGESRLIHFKFEPMILHVLTASPQHAQLLLTCGLQAGFRESGAINLLPPSSSSSTATPMVAIRSMGLGLESLIGRETNGTKHCTVSGEYLKALIRIANERFIENARRIERFRVLLKKAALSGGLDGGVTSSKGRRAVVAAGESWEDADARRERKRAEGLRRAEEVRRLKDEQKGSQFEGQDAEEHVDVGEVVTSA